MMGSHASDRLTMQDAPPPRRSTLADGREILYFDDEPRSWPPAPDTRDLPPLAGAAEMRRDELFDEWVIVAAHRQGRTHLPPTRDCPLCPSRDGAQTEIPDSDYDVVVFENRFPSLPASFPDGPTAGRCEVVCYASQHDATFRGLSDTRLRTVAEAWAHRTRELTADPEIAQIFCFENRGEEIGVTLHHPHGQIYAYPFVPPRVERMVAAAARHRDEKDAACLGCDLLREELTAGDRVVHESEHGVAYVPRAARWPFEIHVVPRRHAPDLAALDRAELHDLVRLQADVLARLEGLFDAPAPYMAGWLQAPTGTARDLLHLRLQIVSPRRAAGKLKYLAGSESLAGAWINDIRPEEAAERLRTAPGR